MFLLYLFVIKLQLSYVCYDSTGFIHILTHIETSLQDRGDGD